MKSLLVKKDPGIVHLAKLGYVFLFTIINYIYNIFKKKRQSKFKRIKKKFKKKLFK